MWFDILQRNFIIGHNSVIFSLEVLFSQHFATLFTPADSLNPTNRIMWISILKIYEERLAVKYGTIV